MSTLTSYKQLTLAELAKRKDPDGDLATIVEVLAEDNEILQDAVWLEANDTFSNKAVRRSLLPSGSWRRLNSGVEIEASGTSEIVDTIGMLETYSEADKVLIDTAPNPTQARMDEDRAFLEGLSQTLATTCIYGNAATDPEQFTGLAPRMASLAATTNVIGAGGTGSDLTSIFGVQWGPDKVCMIYPKGHKGFGVQHRDLGEATANVSSTPATTHSYYQVYRSHFQVMAGLQVKNARSIFRYCNIESTGTSNIFDEDELIRLLNRMPMRGKGTRLYVNETVLTQMEIALKDKNNINYTPARGEGLAGEPMLYFRGCPVRMVDKITITESALT